VSHPKELDGVKEFAVNVSLDGFEVDANTLFGIALFDEPPTALCLGEVIHGVLSFCAVRFFARLINLIIRQGYSTKKRDL
jgi:hypothetical protein